MPKIVSVIPPKGTTITPSQGTKVLLDNGEYLNCINKITLVAEPNEPWKAIIEVYPSNQGQIDALLDEVTVLNQAPSGIFIAGVENVPKEGTYLLRRGEMVITPEQNKNLQEQLDKVASGHGKLR
ncbi:hypothetical protein [Acinetobacter higginsii]|uniref:hypothetical protein n=1 Tax=Acinetobacter higginsii TaxID=70347 RepID=UPI003008DA02